MAAAIRATADLLSRLRIEFVFVGTVAHAAWLDTTVEDGSIDLLALMQPQQKNQVAMMASNRGFRVDREEIEQSEELDLIPFNFLLPEGEVRVHILLASNALYGRMFGTAREASMDDLALRVVAAEDLALFLTMAEDEASIEHRRKLIAAESFDRAAYNQRLRSIGLASQVVPE